LQPDTFDFEAENELWTHNIQYNDSPRVMLTHATYVADTVVTRGEYQNLMGENPSVTDCGPNCPVENVAFFEAVEYANSLSVLTGVSPCYEILDEDLDEDGYPDVNWLLGYDCEGFRLPTIAEWFYFSWADRSMDTYTCCNEGPQDAELQFGMCPIGWLSPGPSDTEWWVEECGDGNPHAVKTKMPNQWGLYDLFGSIAVWLWDRWDTAAVQWCPICNLSLSLSQFTFIDPGAAFVDPEELGMEMTNDIWSEFFLGQRSIASYGYYDDFNDYDAWHDSSLVSANDYGIVKKADPAIPYEPAPGDYEVDRPLGFRLVRTARLKTMEVDQ